MKQRFMEYAKNAQKMEKKSKSEEKYQNVDENKKQVASRNTYDHSQQGTTERPFEKQPITNSIIINKKNANNKAKYQTLEGTEGEAKSTSNPRFSKVKDVSCHYCGIGKYIMLGGLSEF